MKVGSSYLQTQDELDDPAAKTNSVKFNIGSVDVTVEYNDEQSSNQEVMIQNVEAPSDDDDNEPQICSDQLDPVDSLVSAGAHQNIDLVQKGSDLGDQEAQDQAV